MENTGRIPIKITVKGLGESRGELARFLAPQTVAAILKALPLEGKLAVWKEEVYFTTPIKVGLEKEKKTVETGAIAYWPVGSALCIFYGESQPYSPVNVVGKVTENLELFRSAKEGQIIRVERLGD
ncbi:cyclophilin-like fold protein [Candidatus Hecatella orcuttiae]|uniref:cyclophilin-like fold protein n=1 Tax=Candidatus Hecatella orcuttiae TaxID=1935119 RepID=UPI002867D23E|nr:cyclophilin-like fold protein [Candidatus Hecatella orcuttiae]